MIEADSILLDHNAKRILLTFNFQLLTFYSPLSELRSPLLINRSAYFLLFFTSSSILRFQLAASGAWLRIWQTASETLS